MLRHQDTAEPMRHIHKVIPVCIVLCSVSALPTLFNFCDIFEIAVGVCIKVHSRWLILVFCILFVILTFAWWKVLPPPNDAITSKVFRCPLVPFIPCYGILSDIIMIIQLDVSYLGYHCYYSFIQSVHTVFSVDCMGGVGIGGLLYVWRET